MRDENASRWDGTQASKAWRLLEQYLSRYDGSGEYRKRVLDAILEEDRRTRLPKWLVNWFMAAHPEYLIWKSVEYDLLEEAFVHAFQMVEAVRSARQDNSEILADSDICTHAVTSRATAECRDQESWPDVSALQPAGSVTVGRSVGRSCSEAGGNTRAAEGAAQPC